ncbi:MAG: zinc metallopeptidase [Microcoleus sp. CSU_2_2]|nr:zinc metallopeptidase [Microcoleus sp. SU_5_3]NJS12549.1 zinc metallopeptidase [Microcoleus sp. CSU_2_2]
MSSNSSESSDRSSFYASTNQLERIVDRLMPRLHPSWKDILLNDCQTKMTGSEVAREILRKHGRTDVKVCVNEDENNAYSISQVDEVQ